MSFNLTYAGSGGSLLTTVWLGVAVAEAVAAPLLALALGRAPVEVS
jgi:nitrogen fixation/metabolism regulation signal transduction histidine kinase